MTDNVAKLASVDVRFGSKADICSAPTHVRFTPNSDRKSRHPQTLMSALLPKADMCGAHTQVCFGPIADMSRVLSLHYSMTSSARASSAGGTVRPSAFAVLRLIASSYLVGT